MNCKNCEFELFEEDKFCCECGAIIVKDRITTKRLFSNLLQGLGWDSGFFTTLRYLLYKPQVVFKEYIDGTRKKYANPFAFLAIIVAITLFVFSQNSEEFIRMSTNLEQIDFPENTISSSLDDGITFDLFNFENANELKIYIGKLHIKYYNLISFFSLPFYALMALLMFRKSYNYGEQLVINTYIQGIIIFASLLLFIASLVSGFNLFDHRVIYLPSIYYAFAYQRLYKLTFLRFIMKIFRFIVISFIILIITILIGSIYMLVKY